MKGFKVTKHELIPKHEILSKEEKEKLLKDLNISARQLPKIKKKDPVIKEIDAKVGDVIKITRESSVAGKTTYYRIVTKK